MLDDVGDDIVHVQPHGELPLRHPQPWSAEDSKALSDGLTAIRAAILDLNRVADGLINWLNFRSKYGATYAKTNQASGPAPGSQPTGQTGPLHPGDA